MILDFLTSLNCIELLLCAKYGTTLIGRADFLEERLAKVFFHVSEYFYDKPLNLDKKLEGYEKVCQQSAESGIPPSEDIVDAFTHISSHIGFKLTQDFYEILGLVINDQNIEQFMEQNEEISHTKGYKKSTIDNYLEKPCGQILKSFDHARERYFEILKITGYNREELEAELSSMICRPMDTRLVPGPSPQKESAFAKKMRFLKR